MTNSAPKSTLKVCMHPYSVERIHQYTGVQQGFDSLPVNTPFDMADILFEPDSRIFLGLSFPFDDVNQSMVRTLVRKCAHSNVVYMCPESQEIFSKRYLGFDGRHRLEILWTDTTKIYQCEYAGLWECQWILDKNSAELFSSSSMCLYIEFIDDIANEHHLKLNY
jgi:hypothetical protein